MGGLTIKLLDDVGGGNKVLVDRALWLTADGQVVEAGDRRAATLLCSAGKRVSRMLLEKYGVEISTPTSGAKREKEPAEDKSDTSGEDKNAAGAADETPDDDSEPAEDLSELSYRELQQRCKAAGLPAGGSTDDLIARLTEKE